MEIVLVGTFIIVILTWLQTSFSYAAEGVNFFDFWPSSTKDNQRISFSPDDGKKFRRSYEQKYGPRGKLLIESMGQGTAALIPQVDKNKSAAVNNGTKHILKIQKRTSQYKTSNSPTTEPFSSSTLSSTTTITSS